METGAGKTYSEYPDEISLRELIEVILKGWKLIAAITAVAVLVSAAVSFFVITPVYEASATLMASAATKVEAPRSGSGVPGFLDSLSSIPAPTLDTYKEQVKNPIVLHNVIEELDLGAKGLNQRRLSGKISAEIVKDTNLIKIKVKDSAPALAANIANSLAVKFAEHISNLSEERISATYQYLETQMNIEKEMLDEAVNAYKKFLAEPKGVIELKSELDSKVALLDEYNVLYIQKEMEQNAKEAALNVLEREIADTENVLTTQKSLSEDPFLHSALSDSTGENPARIGGISMESQEINPNYIELKGCISKLKSEIAAIKSERLTIRAQIDQSSLSLEGLQSELLEKQLREDALKRNIELAQQAYDAFYNKHEEIRITRSGQVEDASVVLTVSAMEPIVPVSPNKRLNIALSAMLGFMLSAFIVFFKDYWEKSSP